MLFFLLFFVLVPMLQLLQILLSVVSQLFLLLLLDVLRTLLAVNLEAVDLWDELGFKRSRSEVRVNLEYIWIYG